MMPDGILEILEKHKKQFHPLVIRHENELISPVDLSSSNPAFTDHIYNDLDRFSSFIEKEKEKAGSAYLTGGYKEIREMYRRSKLFDSSSEPRNIHLGIDIWGAAGTKIFAPLGGMVHGFAFNNNFGDYGPTIILQHQLDTINFYTLYGHIALADLEYKRKGQFITRGENFAHFGNINENGSWPPHLHFQLILDIGQYEGDYPGVCKLSESAKYLINSPDPAFLLQW
ncbi:MAG TPA: peptidoglycan DD-metalloendopeptidase family protein [Ferruginibacter sp.]|nr:peptidoglycan DD-metalloendopeptidase family protein [Ferruginibacter sp.]